MARDLNRVMLIGRLAADPELRATPSGQSVVNFRIATNRQWNDAQGAPQSQTEFSQIVAWGKLGELTNQYLKKGRQAYIEGRLQTRSWTDKNNVKHWRTEVVAEHVIFLGSPPGDAVGARTPAREESVSAHRSEAGGPAPPLTAAGAPAPSNVPVGARAAGGGEAPLEEIRIEDIPF